MLLNLAPVVAVVKHFPPTRASEIDQSGPFGGWSDADFLAFENQINEQTRERYELRCVRMNEAESEDEADTIAAISDGLEVIDREPCQLCGGPMGSEDGSTHSICSTIEIHYDPRDFDPDYQPDEVDLQEIAESSYQTDDRRSGLAFPEGVPF